MTPPSCSDVHSSCPSPVRCRWTSASRMPTTDSMALAVSHMPKRRYSGVLPVWTAPASYSIPGRRLVQRVEPAVAAERIGQPVGVGVAVDDVLAQLPARGIVDAQPRRHAPRHVVVDDVGAGDEPLGHLQPVGVLEVEGQRPLAALAADERLARPAHGVAADRFDLHHVGTQVGQDHGAERARRGTARSRAAGRRRGRSGGRGTGAADVAAHGGAATAPRRAGVRVAGAGRQRRERPRRCGRRRRAGDPSTAPGVPSRWIGHTHLRRGPTSGSTTVTAVPLAIVWGGAARRRPG